MTSSLLHDESYAVADRLEYAIQLLNERDYEIRELKAELKSINSSRRSWDFRDGSQQMGGS